MNVLVATRDRMLSWAGTCGKDGLQRNLCEGSEMSRPSMVAHGDSFNWKEVEKDKWSGPHPQRFNIYRWEDMVAGEVSKFVGNADGSVENCPRQHGMVAFCSKPWKLEAVFEDVKRALYRWFRVPRGPMRVRHDWDECSGCLDWQRRRIVRERDGEYLLPLFSVPSKF